MFELTMLASFIFACIWAWRQQVLIYECYVCGKRMRHPEAACSERCLFELDRDSRVM